jgi:hydantoinase/carbamoylase family amidase
LLDSAGGTGARISEAKWAAGSIAAYVELHIEQGPVLEEEGSQIGIVQAISGRMTVEVTVRGKANHSGTTPMSLRHDALVAAADVVLAVRQLATADHLVRVATVGACTVSPCVWNVVPGEASLIVDIRDVSRDAMDRALARLRSQTARIGGATGTTIEVALLQIAAPSPCDERIQDNIEKAVVALGLNRLSMPSGAGHDAQWMAELAPMGMIFVPSRAGVSHAPDEWSSPGDLINGANVLLDVTRSVGAPTGF